MCRLKLSENERKTKTKTMTRTKKEESIEVICRKILAEIGKCPEAVFGLGVQNHTKCRLYIIFREKDKMVKTEQSV